MEGPLAHTAEARHAVLDVGHEALARCSPSLPMSIPASTWAATTAAVAARTAWLELGGVDVLPRLRLPWSSARARGRGRLPAWVVRMRVLTEQHRRPACPRRP